MTLSLIDIRMALDEPEQFCEFRIYAEFRLPDACLLVIERPGQEKPYLGVDGWQANYIRLEAVIRYDLPTASCLRVPRGLLRSLETGYNYRISLFDCDGGELGYFVTNWYPPSGIFSPVRSVGGPATEALGKEKIEPDPTYMVELPAKAEPSEKPPPQPSAPKKLLLRQVVRCRNCGGQVFSTVATCPYCGHLPR